MSTPKVTRGMNVYFYPDCSLSSPGHLATVTKVGDQALELQIEGVLGFNIKNGIRYKDDPALLNPNIKKNGCWDVTEVTEALLGLMERNEEVEEEGSVVQEDVKKKVGRPRKS